MRRNGFTLIELLATILILSALILIVAPLVINSVKKGKVLADEETYNSILMAGKNWASDNKNKLEDYTSITIDDLINGGYIDDDIELPSTGDDVDNTCVFVKEVNGNYYYELDKECQLLMDSQEKITYYCPDDYTQSGSGENTICTGKTTAYTNKLSQINYSCPNGYTKSGNGSSTKCSKKTTTTTSRLSSTSYYCPSGYTKSGSGSNITCYKTTTTTTNATASGTSYGCSRTTAPDWSGWKLQLKYFSSYDSVCRSTSISRGYHCVAYSQLRGTVTCKNGAWYSNTYTQDTACMTGWQPSESSYKENGDCAVIGDGEYHPTMDMYKFYDDYLVKTTNYKCPSGYTLSGTKCRKTTKTYTSKRSSTSYYCPSGYTASGSGSSMKCSKTTTSYTNPSTSTSYYCPSGYTASGSGSNITCSKQVTTTTNPGKNINYVCPEGYTQIHGKDKNSQCLKDNVKD